MAVINLRKEDGKLLAVNDIAFVELCTEDNKLIGVIKTNSAPGVLEIYKPGDAMFHKYVKMFKRDSSQISQLKLTWLERKRNAMMQ